jgi:hypothetical protein
LSSRKVEYRSIFHGCQFRRPLPGALSFHILIIADGILCRKMHRNELHILRVAAIFIALVDAAWLCLMFVWLILGGGVIACGRGVFDDPQWPLTVLFLVGIPAAILAGALKLTAYCSRRLAFR